MAHECFILRLLFPHFVNHLLNLGFVEGDQFFAAVHDFALGFNLRNNLVLDFERGEVDLPQNSGHVISVIIG
jgi:hypothetical protein